LLFLQAIFLLLWDCGRIALSTANCGKNPLKEQNGVEFSAVCQLVSGQTVFKDKKRVLTNF